MAILVFCISVRCFYDRAMNTRGSHHNPDDLSGLERSCDDAGERFRPAPVQPGIDRIDARFHGEMFEPHSHEEYALGLTMTGVQLFNYRGSRRASLPGRVIVLHPGEKHDGAAGTEDGLIYRMLYLDTGLIRRAMDDDSAPFPFVGDPVVSDPAFRDVLWRALGDLDHELDELEADAIVADAAALLTRHSAGSKPGRGSVSRKRMEIARDYLQANASESVSSAELEQVTGLDRFTIARQFRRLYATSPHRYLVHRRLNHARRMIEAGEPLAEAAAEAGFADQSHLNRHFRKAYGITPGRWRQLTVESRG
jgi:AraC-like DNA-binding protein